MSLAGVGAVVTGGASGIGKGVTEALLAEGADVVIADVQAELAKEFVAHRPGRITFVECDVTKLKDLQAVEAAAASLANGAAIWFLNAGITTENIEDILQMPNGKRWKKMIDINVTAVIEGAQIAYEHMKRHKVPGTKFIIGTASMAGLLPQTAPVYAATKAAVIQFQRSLATRLKAANKRDILCYTLCPSFTDTPLARGDISINASGDIVRGAGTWDAATKERMTKEIGAILDIKDMVAGVMGLIARQPPSGAVLRVTMRRGGAAVVHDLVSYGKELGGNAAPRPGIELFHGDLSKL